MPFFACDENDRIVPAPIAHKTGTYHCLECFMPVQLRKSRLFTAHFYHTKTSPRCRLYSKTEDHLLAQLQLQKLFAPGQIAIERPFLDISRIADACWEEKKLIFEIQCSHLEIPEAEKRMNDYLSRGYQVIWLLHDKLFNRKTVRPVESFLRKFPTYYIRIQRGAFSTYYDQFEIIQKDRRLKKSHRMPIDLKNPLYLTHTKWSDACPKQLIERASRSSLYFPGDRIHRAQHAHPAQLDSWRILELQAEKKPKKPSRFKTFLKRYLLEPYLRFLMRRSTE